MFKNKIKTSASRQAAVLEITPRAAKVVIASSTSPLQIERVNASTLADRAGDALAAVKALLDQPIGVKEVGVLFGREVFSLQRLELPSVDPKEISSMLELQLGKLTPYPRSDILYSYMPIGSLRQGYTTVLLAISPKKLIDEILQHCKSKGLSAQWVSVSTEGLEAWWAQSQIGAPVAQGQLMVVIDVDFASTDCAILSADNQLLFTHSIPIGAEQLATNEQAKLRWLGDLVRLPRILVHEDVKGQIGRGVMTGITEGLDSILEQIMNQWGVAIDALDPLRIVASESVRAKARLTRVSYTAAVGALKLGRAPRLDLIPQEARVSQALHSRSRGLEQLVMNLVAVLCLAMLLIGERMWLLGRYHEQLKEHLAPLEEKTAVISRQQNTMRQLQAWLDPSRSALGVMQAVALAADPTITVTQLSFKAGEPVKIRGNATTSQAPYEFLDRLKKQKNAAVGSSCLAEVRVTGARGAEFDINCALGS